MSDLRLFNNRELSWLSFNKRVVLQARDENVPLLEKLRFLAISSTNLDEFFMVRVGGLVDHVAAGYIEKDLSGRTSRQQLKEISEECHNLSTIQSDIYYDLKQQCAEEKIYIEAEIQENFEWIESLFHEEIFPVISPVTLGPANPFPFLANLRMCILVRIKQNNKEYDSLIMIPEMLERIYRLKRNGRSYYYTVEQIITNFLPTIYKGYDIIDSFVFRITRNADLSLHDEEVEDLLILIEKYLDKRKKSNPVRLEVNKPLPQDLKVKFNNFFDIPDSHIYELNHPLDLSFLFNIKENNKKYHYPGFNPWLPHDVKDKNFFDYLKTKDLILYRPYHDFGLIGNFVQQAAEDPNVLSIKMTLYRANENSNIINSLAKAAKKGKHVCVIIELKARFDEERNVEWAKRLENAGCIVTYGFMDLKVHAKALLIVRKEKGKIQRYVHMATGNYNEKTAKLYTDIDYLTTDKQIAAETVNLFNYLMGYSNIYKWRLSENTEQKVTTAPNSLREKLQELIDEEIKNARKGKKGHIIAKINSLYDKELTLKLYEASSVGVKVELIVRGICSLKPQVKGLSENITVKSIVGRFLEHPRVLYFLSSGSHRVFISTADWMVRNLDRRVELLIEIEDKKSKKFLQQLLRDNLKDRAKSWYMNDDKYFKLNQESNTGYNYQEEYITGINDASE
ncbi:MAG: polyphosphate kinase 1 [Flexistipes sinusarabici]|uniref:Polyphosphate kinase n=1 Tax=Flexistipes sinusarabici TaxID=2352 RepID=A0A5D0MWQ5_FLESI|nr:polyphosphate kinase 1 [Flexistipes sinusarabici]TYB36451.1 MAG: polyphosphate kinase 1 [Flexistipes sinusarabici]